MPLSDVLLHLSSHGCNDVYKDLDKSKCSEYPDRIGGSGEACRGALRNGTKVSIQFLKIMNPNWGREEAVQEAPEIVLDSVQLRFKADIYSLGMTILEVITGAPPYESLGELAALGKIMAKTGTTRVTDSLWSQASRPFVVAAYQLLESELERPSYCQRSRIGDR
ncbi:hypothetical protein RSAG8_09834, partial [Rhizoctonia solani AG-8 WAC10335]